MKRVWKWVIGIVIVLVVVAAVAVGVFLLVRGQFGGLAFGGGVNRPGVGPYRNYGYRGMPMFGPGMMGYGRGLPFVGFFGGLICLGILALLILGIIWLVRAVRKPAQVSAVAAQPVAPVAQTSVPVTPIAAAPVAEVHPCPNCGEPVQESWNHCPNCGTKLK